MGTVVDKYSVSKHPKDLKVQKVSETYGIKLLYIIQKYYDQFI